MDFTKGTEAIPRQNQGTLVELPHIAAVLNDVQAAKSPEHRDGVAAQIGASLSLYPNHLKDAVDAQAKLKNHHQTWVAIALCVKACWFAEKVKGSAEKHCNTKTAVIPPP